MLLNEATNRAVKVDGATYQRLVSQGYTVCATGEVLVCWGALHVPVW